MRVLIYQSLHDQTSYWELNRSETHKHNNNGLFFDIFRDLFYDQSYSVDGIELQKSNKRRSTVLYFFDKKNLFAIS
ncbi:22248_t:CDS:2 [Entrophospora sp. SA101]|nr:22248_t:CDS:2 [Entrophospora sp. SA101]